MNWDQICGQIPDSDNVQKMAYLNEVDFIKIFVMKPENGMYLNIFEIIYVLFFYWPKLILYWSKKLQVLLPVRDIKETKTPIQKFTNSRIESAAKCLLNPLKFYLKCRIRNNTP